MTFDIDTIISKINLEQSQILRRDYSSIDWRMDNMLELFERLGKTFCKDFVIDANNQRCYENLIYWLLNDPRMVCANPSDGKVIPGRLKKGLYIYGPTGTGKTLATKVLARMSYCIGTTYKYDNATSLFQWSSYRTDELTDKYAHGDMLDDYKSAQIICFQDLGSEPIETLYMGNRMNVMKNILEQRGERDQYITIITSNIPLDSPDLAAKYGDRVVSRLYDMCNFLVLRGNDRRKILSQDVPK